MFGRLKSPTGGLTAMRCHKSTSLFALCIRDDYYRVHRRDPRGWHLRDQGAANPPSSVVLAFARVVAVRHWSVFRPPPP